MKQMLKITLSVMLTLTLNCQKTSALELNPRPNDFSCLTREEKDNIEDAKSGLKICEITVKAMKTADHDYWMAIEISVLGGIVAGALLNQQLRK